MWFAAAAAEVKPAEKVPERRLWLTGSVESSPGVLGLFRTARTEPMGERLRVLYNGDAKLTPARGKPQDQKGESLAYCNVLGSSMHQSSVFSQRALRPGRRSVCWKVEWVCQ